MTVSRLWLTPEEEDDGEVLTCKAGLPNLPQSSVQNSWNLQVNCELKIFLKLLCSSNMSLYSKTNQRLSSHLDRSLKPQISKKEMMYILSVK